ncbi:Pycsar system effector family protein [Methylopila henanensis]|uniref:Pycsar system effector family protein n=1 Tax=Methylopila henanensis TaxID=873516 RepID=A0ABW4K9Q2_9HYPH
MTPDQTAKEPAADLAYLQKINDVFYDQLKVADQKATYIMTIIVFLLVWSPDVRKLFFWRGHAVELSAASLLSLALVAALLTALASALAVVTPRRRRGGAALFWGAWPDVRPEVERITAAADRAAIAASYADNAQNLAALCRLKYRFVTLAFGALIVALAAHGGLVVLG